jgi:hypothetical protein
VARASGSTQHGLKSRAGEYWGEPSPPCKGHLKRARRLGYQTHDAFACRRMFCRWSKSLGSSQLKVHTGTEGERSHYRATESCESKVRR